MRLAVISDVHGNLPALEAVLAHIEARRPDQVVVAGDLVNRGPQSNEVVARLQPLGYPTVQGNHERYVLEAADATDPQAGGDTYEPSRWTLRQLTPDQVAYLRALPFSVRVEDVLIVHGSPRGDQDGIFPRTSEGELSQKLNGHTHLVCGHTHLSLVRPWRERGLVVNAGSAGNTFEGDTRARYAWLERRSGQWHAEVVCVDYDVAATLRAFDESDYLATAGPMARLFRLEVATGHNHLIPAYLAHRRLVDTQQMTLAEAADRYLETLGL